MATNTAVLLPQCVPSPSVGISNTITVSTGQNDSDIINAISQNQGYDPMAVALSKVLCKQRYFKSLPKTDPFYQRYSKAWNIINPDAALNNPQPEGFTNAGGFTNIEGFQDAAATPIKPPKALRNRYAVGLTGVTMGVAACFQSEVSCGISNTMYRGNQDCSTSGQYPQSDLNQGNYTVSSASGAAGRLL